MEVDRNSGIPDAAYSRRVAQAEYRWHHRGELDPLEGFKRGPTATTAEITPAAGTINFGPESTGMGNP